MLVAYCDWNRLFALHCTAGRQAVGRAGRQAGWRAGGQAGRQLGGLASWRAGGQAGRRAGQYEDTYVNTVQYITRIFDTLAELLSKDTTR